MKPRSIKGQIVTAYAEGAAGPGWANSPIWVIVRGLDGSLRQECIQPSEQTRDMVTLYGVSQAAHAGMCAAVRNAQGKSAP